MIFKKQDIQAFFFQLLYKKIKFERSKNIDKKPEQDHT